MSIQVSQLAGLLFNPSSHFSLFIFTYYALYTIIENYNKVPLKIYIHIFIIYILIGQFFLIILILMKCVH